MFADVTGYTVRTPIEDAEADWGDVMLAGLGTGILSVDDVQKWQVLGDKVEPDPKRHEAYNKYYKLYRQLYKDLEGDMHTLTEVTRETEKLLSDDNKALV